MKIILASPCYQQTTWAAYTRSMVKSVNILDAIGVEWDYWQLCGDSYIDRARNNIADAFLRSDATHLFFIDTDMGWDAQSFANIIKADVDIVGAGYPCKNNWDFYSCILNTDERGVPLGNPETGLLEAWGVPTGFMKISRRAFEVVRDFEPENYYLSDDKEEQRKIHGFFNHVFENNRRFGEDISFCVRARAAGLKIWCEPRCTMEHWGVKAWAGNYSEFLTSLPKPAERPAEPTDVLLAEVA